MSSPTPYRLPTSGRTFADFWGSLGVADHGIYRAYDSEGRLLYVGLTRGLRARFRQHFEESDWTRAMTRLEFEPVYTEAQARAEEARLIRELRPLHNKVHALWDRAERTGPLPRRGRRELVLSALAGKNKTLLARRHGVSRRYIYDLLEEATADPEGKVQEAVAEAAFRREVRDILARKAAASGDD